MKAGAKHTASSMHRTDKHLEKVLGLAAGFYPNVGRQGKTWGWGWAGGMGGARGPEEWSRFVDVEGTGWDYGKGEPRYGRNALYPMAGKRVWYQNIPQDYHEGAKLDIEKNIAQNKYGFYKHKYPYLGTRAANLDKFYESDDPALFRMGESLFEGVFSGYDTPDLKDGGAPGRLVRDVLIEYRKNVGRYSGKMLTVLNRIASEQVKLSLKGKRGTEEREVPRTAGAIMPEEETKAAAAYYKSTKDGEGGAIAGGEAGRTVGRTQQVDTFLKVGGVIIPADVSEMTIAQGGHHGISSRILSKDKIGELIDEGEAGEEKIRTEIYKYFKGQMEVYNVAIKTIRDKAIDTHQDAVNQAKPRAPTPGEMRAPFKSSEFWVNNFGERQYALQSANPHKGKKAGPKWIQSVLNKEGADALSSSAHTVQKKLFKDAKKVETSRGKVKITKSITSFVLHVLGTYHQHNGRLINSMTVSHDPHITAGVLMRMYKNMPRKYEFKALRNKDVLLKHGYFTLASMVDAGHLAQEDYGVAVHDMKAANLYRVYSSKKNNLVLNKMANSGLASIGKSPRTGYTTYIPDVLGQERMRRIHEKLSTGDYVTWNRFRVAVGGRMGQDPGPARAFNNYLQGIQTAAMREYSGNMGERITWPETSWMNALPYVGLLEQK